MGADEFVASEGVKERQYGVAQTRGSLRQAGVGRLEAVECAYVEMMVAEPAAFDREALTWRVDRVETSAVGHVQPVLAGADRDDVDTVVVLASPGTARCGEPVAAQQRSEATADQGVEDCSRLTRCGISLAPHSGGLVLAQLLTARGGLGLLPENYADSFDQIAAGQVGEQLRGKTA